MCVVMHIGAIRRKGKKIMGIVDALKNGRVEYTGNKSSNVKIELGNGNANINVRGNNVDITTGTGNQNVVVLGNDVDIKLDTNALSDWDSSLDQDMVAVVSDKGTVNINTGDGNDTALTVADNVNIEMGKGDHLVGFWGDDVKIKADDGSNTIMTMDKMIANGTISENTTILGEKIGQAAIDAVELRTTESTELLYDITSETGNNGKADFMKKMQDTYKLDASNMKMLDTLYENGELFKEYAKGVPAYAIVQSVTQKNADGSAKYVLARVDGQNDDGYIHTRGLQDGTFKECIATKQRGTNSYTVEQEYTRETATRTTYKVDGTKNLDIDLANGKTNNIDVTSTGIVDIKAGDFDFSRIKVDAEVKVIGDPDVVKNVYTEPARRIAWGTNIGETYTSPIIVDFNKDGKVDATSGNTGIDADRNGIADGAATGGDKMLAMSDMNGNGKVDGSEVFGDQTVSPFTGEKINATNGFEALKTIAQQAEEKTGIKCYSGGLVDLQALKSALATVGVNLGFISDDNVTELEDLAHVVALNVDNYNQVDEEGDVQHRQQGSYVANDGQTYGANDVWFKDRTQMDNMIDRLKKSK